MASQNTAPVQSKSASPTAGTDDWYEDNRSLPMYNVTECEKQAIRGYLVGVDVLGGSADGSSKPFKALIVKLTAPCSAKVNEEIKVIPAGKEIYIHGADLRDLDRAALDPDNVFEYLLIPGKAIKLKQGSMQTWERKRNPKTFKRAEVCPNRVQALPSPAEIRGLLAARSEDPSFDPQEIEAERVK